MPDLMRVRTVFEYGAGSPGLMTQYFGNDTGSYNDADAQVAVDRVRDAMITAPALWPPSFTWTIQGDVDVLADTTGVVSSHHGVTSRTGLGTNTGSLGPLPVGILLQSHTGAYVGGHRLIGRTYFVPIAAGATDGPVVPDAWRGSVLDTGNALLAAGLTFVVPYVWSRPRPATAVGPHRPAGAARAARVGSSAKVTSYSVPAKWAILTSRRD